jgi:hypothetical protein
MEGLKKLKSHTPEEEEKDGGGSLWGEVFGVKNGVDWKNTFLCVFLEG